MMEIQVNQGAVDGGKGSTVDIEFLLGPSGTLSLAKYLQQVGRSCGDQRRQEACMLIDNVGAALHFQTSQRWNWDTMFRGRTLPRRMNSCLPLPFQCG